VPKFPLKEQDNLLHAPIFDSTNQELITLINDIFPTSYQ
jgi:hypothetical protein